MNIYIAHLYYDLMNLYGEIGNVKALENSLTNEGIKVIVDKLSINDKIDFNKYDLIYIGSGTEDNQLIVLKDLIKYKNRIKEYIENNKFIIATGNSFELFGKSIYYGTKHTALGIFDFNTKVSNKRIVGDLIVKSKYFDKNIIGFQNYSGIVTGTHNPLFEILSGGNEGISYKNFYGTHLLGPILVRNPELQRHIISNLIKNKDKNYKLKKIDLSLDEKAYDIYMNNYHIN